MDYSKKDLAKLISAGSTETVQLTKRDFGTSNGKDILCSIIVNGVLQHDYTCCCICKNLLKKGSSNKA